MRRFASGMTLVPLVAAAALATGCSDSPVSPVHGPPPSTASVTAARAASGTMAGMPAKWVYRVNLMPLNHSGVHGTATVSVAKGELTVVLNAVGEVPGEVHAQHIHGFTDGTDGQCPPPGYDGGDGDGVLTFAEAAPYFGPVQQALTPFPMPTNQGGAISYKESFPVDGLAFSPTELSLKSIVLHGAYVSGDYVPSLPVACGTLEPVN